MAQPTALPVIDISRFRAPVTERAAFLAERRSAAHEVGIFYVTGHDVPEALRDEVLSAARAFFARPEERRLFSHLANIGDVRRLVIKPASTTHAPAGSRSAGRGRGRSSPAWCRCRSASKASTT
ncbi:2-oxoglutarate and iron-dependent oxygenase domain-containing protein [Streptomyces sp. NPDC002144]